MRRILWDYTVATNRDRSSMLVGIADKGYCEVDFGDEWDGPVMSLPS